jgi:AraC-like DNA-binding protein
VRYQEYAPSPRLASTIACVWTLEGHAREFSEVQPILPDGRPEIIVHLGDPFERIESTDKNRQSSVLFAGQLVGPLILRPTGAVGVVGVRLHPHGAAALVKQPQEALVGTTIGVDALDARLACALSGIRDRTSSVDVAVPLVQRAMEMLVDDSRVDRRVSAAVGYIGVTRGRVSVDEIARHVGLTSRHLERRFKTAVGISPKRLARITRFQRALRLLETRDGLQRGADTAAMCGYADQAHLIRDFREMAGCPPGAHLLRQAELTGFFSAGAESRIR